MATVERTPDLGFLFAKAAHSLQTEMTARLEHMAREKALAAYFHRGFWQPMDTLRDKNHLEALWASGEAPWRR